MAAPDLRLRTPTGTGAASSIKSANGSRASRRGKTKPFLETKTEGRCGASRGSAKHLCARPTRKYLTVVALSWKRESGQSQPQLRISKEGDRYLRALLVQGAHVILNRRGPDTDLKRWGLKLAQRGGKNAKKRAIVAVARKLAVLLHRLWV